MKQLGGQQLALKTAWHAQPVVATLTHLWVLRQACWHAGLYCCNSDSPVGVQTACWLQPVVTEPAAARWRLAVAAAAAAVSHAALAVPAQQISIHLRRALHLKVSSPLAPP